MDNTFQAPLSIIIYQLDTDGAGNCVNRGNGHAWAVGNMISHTTFYRNKALVFNTTPVPYILPFLRTWVAIYRPISSKQHVEYHIFSNLIRTFPSPLPTRQTDWIILDVGCYHQIYQEVLHKQCFGWIWRCEDDGEDKDDSDWVTDNDSVMSDDGESDE